MFTQYRIPKRPKYTNDEIKLNIKRFEKKIIKLQNQYDTALLREREVFSKPHMIIDIGICHDKYGHPKIINGDINKFKKTIEYLKKILEGEENNE